MRFAKVSSINALVLAVSFLPEVAANQSAQAQTFTVLYSFTLGVDGGEPYAGVIRDAQGNLFGTTPYGGASSLGTVFKVDSSGVETVLHSFTGEVDGIYPFADLVRDRAGTLYGTTSAGGTFGYGTVFKVDTSGAETVLYSFAGRTTDGCNPNGSVLRDKTGNLYGTTMNCGAFGAGTVFKLTKNGRERVLHSFAQGPLDGAYPNFSGLLMDTVGNLYGVTSGGGTSAAGVVYKLDKRRKLTLLHSFDGSDGCFPSGTPIMDTEGNLYGTTYLCGPFDSGTVWKVTKRGTERVLHNFAGAPTDGADPTPGVIRDAKGNLYGDTMGGGSSDVGTVYKLDKRGKLTLLHSFDGSDGGGPSGKLIRDAKGNFYGTTRGGGSGRFGTVWKLTK